MVDFTKIHASEEKSMNAKDVHEFVLGLGLLVFRDFVSSLPV